MYLYSALFVVPGYVTLKALRHRSHSFTCNYTNACLYLVSVHQMAPPQTEVAACGHLIAASYQPRKDKRLCLDKSDKSEISMLEDSVCNNGDEVDETNDCDVFSSCVSILTRDIDIAILSVRPSVCLSVRNVPVLDKNGLTYRHSFFHHKVAQSF